MSRNKSMTKSGWRARDRKFRTEQNANAKANRFRKLFAIMAGGNTEQPSTGPNRAARRVGRVQQVITTPEG